MRRLILGGGGFLGRRLAKELIQNGGLAQGEIVRLTMVDIAFEDRLHDSRVEYIQADFSHEVTITNILQQQPDVIFHLAAIVSGEAEKNLELGMKIKFPCFVYRVLGIMQKACYSSPDCFCKFLRSIWRRCFKGNN